MIMKQPDYDEKIDIWSIGCVLSDIINQLDTNSSQKYDRTIFPGSSCFPLSPYPSADESEESAAIIDTNDQLFKILEHKKHTMDDFSFIENELAREYLVKVNRSIKVKEEADMR